VSQGSFRSGLPAVVLVAHDKPRHLRKLLRALAPLPVFLHIDATTAPAMLERMVADLPDYVTLLPRVRAGWAQFGVLEAELIGYRAALAATDAQHVILGTGADYPLASVDRITAALAAHPDRSYAEINPLPIKAWGLARGYDRFFLRQRVWRRHRLVSPLPRRIPDGLRPGGGAQTKILTRRHAEIVLDVVDHRPELVEFFRRCWTPDEVMIPSILVSECFGARWDQEGSSEPHRWYIDWAKKRAKNPRWLGMRDLPALREAAERADRPALFARKFADDSVDLTDAIDTHLRAREGSDERR